MIINAYLILVTGFFLLGSIQFTHLKCKIQCFLVHSLSWQSQSNLKHFGKTPYPLVITPHSVLSSALENCQSLFLTLRFAYSGHFIKIKSYNMWLSWLLSLNIMFSGFTHVSVSHSFHCQIILLAWIMSHFTYPFININS